MNPKNNKTRNSGQLMLIELTTQVHLKVKRMCPKRETLNV